MYYLTQTKDVLPSKYRQNKNVLMTRPEFSWVFGAFLSLAASGLLHFSFLDFKDLLRSAGALTLKNFLSTFISKDCAIFSGIQSFHHNFTTNTSHIMTFDVELVEFLLCNFRRQPFSVGPDFSESGVYDSQTHHLIHVTETTNQNKRDMWARREESDGLRKTVITCFWNKPCFGAK